MERLAAGLLPSQMSFVTTMGGFGSNARKSAAGSVGQGLSKIAVQVQNIPARGLASVSNTLSGRVSGTFSQLSSSFVLNTSSAGDYFGAL